LPKRKLKKRRRIKYSFVLYTHFVTTKRCSSREHRFSWFPTMTALSTLWNATKHENGFDLVQEAAELGFPAIEGNHKITERMFEDITACVDREAIRLVSLHNFTPLSESLTKRETVKGPCFGAVPRSLDELAEYASQHGLKLGIENRARFCETLSFEEIEAVWERFDPSAIGY
jgi:hypothetical protein